MFIDKQEKGMRAENDCEMLSTPQHLILKLVPS